MPYISSDKRHVLDGAVDELHRLLTGLQLDDSENNMEGNLNYIITRLLRKTYSTSYRDINDAVGMLQCVILEHYRTVAAPYEDQKKFENGDVDIGSANILLNEVVVEEDK